ncbi:hypothetical protein EE612_025043, partial [Oryza sativa]
RRVALAVANTILQEPVALPAASVLLIIEPSPAGRRSLPSVFDCLRLVAVTGYFSSSGILEDL